MPERAPPPRLSGLSGLKLAQAGQVYVAICNISVYVCAYINILFICIYIYIYRERERCIYTHIMYAHIYVVVLFCVAYSEGIRTTKRKLQKEQRTQHTYMLFFFRASQGERRGLRLQTGGP